MKTAKTAIPALVLGFAIVIQAGAQVPEMIHYQGRLVEGTNLVTGITEMVFRIFDAESSGNALYAETQEVAVVDGLYAASIGASNTVPGNLVSAIMYDGIWLEVEVDGVTLSPRDRIQSVAYALMAQETPHGAVTTEMLAGSSVTSTKILDGTVAASDLNTLSVDARYLNKTGDTMTGDLALSGGATLDVPAGENKVGCLYNTLGDLPSAAIYHGMFAHVHQEGKAYYAHSGQWVALADENHQHAAASHDSLVGLDDDDHRQYHNDARADTRYYTKTQLENGQLDSRYLTESEVQGQYVRSTGDAMTGDLVLSGSAINAAGQSLTLKVNGQRAFEAQSASDAPNIIAGSTVNSIKSGTVGAVIGGGGTNTIEESSNFSTISGGVDNEVGTAAIFATISGGFRNSILANFGGVVGGGLMNNIGPIAQAATIAGGFTNAIGSAAEFATIGGGVSNSIGSGARFAVIPGGAYNEANEAFTFAAGQRAKADHPGAFVWADNREFDFTSTATNQFSARATGGARFVSGIDAGGAPTTGVTLPAGSGSWSSLSDRNLKEHPVPVDTRAILEKLVRMPVTEWNYAAQDRSIRHVGPMAQDFADAFRVGEDRRYIASTDADGVTMAAVQGLYDLLQEMSIEKDERIQEQQKEIERLKTRLARIEQQERHQD